MHIHANNNLLLASLGVGREEAQEIAANRAAQVRRKLSTASSQIGLTESEFSSVGTRVQANSYEAEQQRQDGFGRLFSAKA